MELFGKAVTGDATQIREVSTIQNQVDMLCASGRYVALGMLSELYSNRPGASMKSPCPLQIIDSADLSSFPINSAIAQEPYGKLAPVTFYFG
ncbi:hypothetical protein PENTCL1PPCAC_9975, partial [Pristionchus entomophagus]